MFHVQRPKKPRFKLPATAPDLDKLQRALGDALEAANVIKNDSRIVTWHATKEYAPQGKTGVTLKIQPQATTLGVFTSKGKK